MTVNQRRRRRRRFAQTARSFARKLIPFWHFEPV